MFDLSGCGNPKPFLGRLMRFQFIRHRYPFSNFKRTIVPDSEDTQKGFPLQKGAKRQVGGAIG